MNLYPNAAPIAGLIGGLMIGLAAALVLLGLGRIAGVSGMAARAAFIAPSGPPHRVAIAFVLGLPLGAYAVALFFGPIVTRFPASPVILAVAGLIVGFGTRLGSGCTSGHGVCGLSRLSPRSVIATLVFMATGAGAVAVMNALGAGW